MNESFVLSTGNEVGGQSGFRGYFPAQPLRPGSDAVRCCLCHRVSGVLR